MLTSMKVEVSEVLSVNVNVNVNVKLCPLQ